MFHPAARALLRRPQAARVALRNASTTSEATNAVSSQATKAKETASQVASKASSQASAGLSRVNSSAVSATSKASSAVSSTASQASGRVGQMVNFAQCKIRGCRSLRMRTILTSNSSRSSYSLLLACRTRTRKADRSGSQDEPTVRGLMYCLSLIHI